MVKEKIIYLYPTSSAFVKKDLNFLSQQYTVLDFEDNWGNKQQVPLLFLKQFFSLLRHQPTAKAVIVMFGGYWSFWPSLLGKIFNKPVYIILAGTDCVSFPSINYGDMNNPIMRWFIKWSYTFCTMLLPVDKSLVWNEYNYYERSRYKFQGYTYFLPSIKTPYKVVPFGFDIQLFDRDSSIPKKPNSFISVATANDFTRVTLKGIDKMVEMARMFPQCTFAVVGVAKHISSQMSLPPNITLHGFLPAEEFRVYLNESEFYVQMSLSEGFPNALCEGMLCECIPIGSSVGAIPYIIQDTGFVIRRSDSDHIRSRFEEIMQIDAKTKEQLGKAARERIATNFNMRKRELTFQQLLDPSIPIKELQDEGLG